MMNDEMMLDGGSWKYGSDLMTAAIADGAAAGSSAAVRRQLIR